MLRYQYDWSGSGWHVGQPKSLDTPAVLGFPTYDDVWDARLALTVRF